MNLEIPNTKTQLRAWIKDLKATTPCADCNQYFPPDVMDFDHLPEYTKSENVSVLLSKITDPEILRAEINKCELVCSNCHRLRTASRRKQKKQLPTPMPVRNSTSFKYVTHLTDQSVRSLTYKPGQLTYLDISVPGFGVRVGKIRKTFTLLFGKARHRVTVGHYPSMSVQQARERARSLKLQFAPVPNSTPDIHTRLSAIEDILHQLLERYEQKESTNRPN